MHACTSQCFPNVDINQKVTNSRRALSLSLSLSLWFSSPPASFSVPESQPCFCEPAHSVNASLSSIHNWFRLYKFPRERGPINNRFTCGTLHQLVSIRANCQGDSEICRDVTAEKMEQYFLHDTSVSSDKNVGQEFVQALKVASIFDTRHRQSV